VDLPEIGYPAPGFCLPDADNRRYCLADFKGAFVIVYFYPKDNSSACTLEAVSFSEEIGEFSRLGIPVIGISPDTPESHRAFADRHDLKVTLLADPGHEVLALYGVWQEKKLYGRTFMGVVRTTFIIDPEGAIAAIWPKVPVKGHVDAVKETLSGLMNT
jgi:peroxiredoxin Q/BCP